MNSKFTLLAKGISAAIFLALSNSVWADVITDWNDLLLDTFAGIGSAATPPGNARSLAIVSVSVYEAVNSVDRTHTPYASYLDNYSGAVDTRAAAAQAARDSVVNLYGSYSVNYGSGSVNVTTYADNLLASQLSSMGLDPTVQANSLALGSSAASSILGIRANDGYNAPYDYTPQPDGTPGAWQPGIVSSNGWTAVQGTFLQAQAGYMTPWAMNSSDALRPGPPPALTSTQYAAEFNQVKSLGGVGSTMRTTDQTNIAYFWMDGPRTESPPGHWNSIAKTVSTGLSIQEKARLFALLNVANADASIATWEAKRYYETWRPNQAIDNADIDGNPDTDLEQGWTSLIGTPTFPAYSSGHSAFSQTSADILELYFGTDNIAFTTTTEYPTWMLDTNGAPNSRSFTSFEAAADEAGMSRIYGGIHFMADNIAGQQIGADLAPIVYNNLFTAVAPVPEPGSAMLAMCAMLSLGLRRRRE